MAPNLAEFARRSTFNIWIVAAMGMAIGAGYVPGGIGLALLTRAVLSGIGTWELSHYGGRHEATVWLVFDPDHGKTEIKIECLLDEFTIPKSRVRRADEPDGRQRWEIHFRLTARRAREFLMELVKMSEVHKIERKKSTPEGFWRIPSGSSSVSFMLAKVVLLCDYQDLQILANNPFLRLAAQPLVPVAQPCWYSFWS